MMRVLTLSIVFFRDSNMYSTMNTTVK